jgi:hypothetical protein
MGFNHGYGHHTQHPPGSVYGYGSPMNQQPYPAPQQQTGQPGYYGGGGVPYGVHSPMTQWKAYFNEHQHAWTDYSFINFVLNMPWYIIVFLAAFISFVLLWHINPSYVQQKPDLVEKSSPCALSMEKLSATAAAAESAPPESHTKKYPPSLVRVSVCALVIASIFLILCYLLLRVLVGTSKIQKPVLNGGLPMQQQNP